MASSSTTELSEITAFLNFVDYFTQRCCHSSSCYDFSITDLRTKISQLKTGEDNLLIFYLHYSDEFAVNFCDFLQHPDVERSFHKDKFIFYSWDMGDANLKPDLIRSIKNEIDDGAYLIEQSRSVVMVIKSGENMPYILHVYDDAADLEHLYNILNETPINNEPENIFTPLDYQKLMASYLGDTEYTSFERTEHDLLKKKIGFALYGPPTKESGEYDSDQQKGEIQKLYSLILQENNAFCKWEGRIVISFIFVCAEALPEHKAKRAKQFEKKNLPYHPEADFMPYPVFILRKCKCKGNPSNACRIIIDHEGRVYNSWKNYLEKNRLPPCKMIFPKDGRYDCEDEFPWKLSPACDISKKVANGVDISTGVLGIVAGGTSVVASSSTVLAAAPALAVAAPVLLPAAAVVGIGAGIYAAGRSIYSLVDRKKHKQDINLLNSESRGAYLNIAGSVLSVGMFGAAKTVAFLTNRGMQLGQGTKYILYGINGFNLGVNGLGIVNNAYETYRTKSTSPLAIMQLGASILFFGNAVYNFKTIGNLVKENDTQALNEIESSLRSNRHRQTFNKLLKESIRTQGEAQGKASVVASIRNMENVDEVMATLTRSNKKLNSQGIRFSAQNGEIHLNGVPVDITQFGNMNSRNQASMLETLPPIPENLSLTAQYNIKQELINCCTDLGMWGTLMSVQSIEKLVREVFSAFKPFVRNFIIDISKRFFKKLDPAIANKLTQDICDVTFKILKWLVDSMKSNIVFQKVVAHHEVSPEEIDSLVDYLQKAFCSDYANYICDTAIHEERKRKRREGVKEKIRETCKTCSGHYYL